MQFDYSLEPGKQLLDKYEVDSSEAPLISIVTPFYNSGKTIGQTYNSVMNQTFPYYEWIVVDDGSTDEAATLKLEELAATDKRMRVLRKENGGTAEARNIGIAAAAADIVVPLDADDLILPTFLEHMYWALLKNPEAAWAYCGLAEFGSSRLLWSKEFSSEAERGENIVVVCAAIRKAELLAVGGYHVGGRHFHEDWHLWLKLLAAGKQPVQLKDYSGFWYRRSETGELAFIKNSPEIRAQIVALISEMAQRVPDGIRAIQGMGMRRKDYPLPKASEWERRLKHRQEKTRVLLLLPRLAEEDAGSFILDAVSRMNPEKYEFSVITTQPCAMEDSVKQRFEPYVTDIFDLPQFLSVDDYAEFIHYFIKSRGIGSVFLSNSDYGRCLLPWLRLLFPDIVFWGRLHAENDFASKSEIIGRMALCCQREYPEKYMPPLYMPDSRPSG
jgi:glycosyltransferase involved in cell wall biosynthesis